MLVGLVWACRRGSPAGGCSAGLLIGLAAMVKPIAQGFLPLAIVAAYLVGASWRALVGQIAWPAPTRAALIAAAMVAVGYGLAIAPWSIRNQLAHNLASPSTFGRTLIARTASYDRGFVFVDPSPAGADPLKARAAADRPARRRSRRLGRHDRPAAAPGARPRSGRGERRDARPRDPGDPPPAALLRGGLAAVRRSGSSTASRSACATTRPSARTSSGTSGRGRC